MLKTIINAIAFVLVAIGAYQGYTAFMNVTVTSEPLAYTASGLFILLITNVTGE